MSKGRHPLTQFTLEMLPFADAASEGLPLKRLVRMSLFQVSVGMATVLLLGTLNRVMIVELSVPAMLVACMIALPVLVAPFRALLGFRSDTHKSAIGWKRVPYLWFGSLYQFGGLAIMPFSLILLSGDQTLGPAWAGEAIAAVAFLMTGLGLHMTQTAGLALASDQATDETRPRVVALLYVMFLLGMAVSAILFGLLLADFSKLRLIQVIQGAAVVTLALNLVALWKQEKMAPMSRAERATPRPAFRAALAEVWADRRARLFAIFVFASMFAYNAQDLILEPFAGHVFGMTPGESTALGGQLHAGALMGMLAVLLTSTLLRRWLNVPVRGWIVGGCLASGASLIGLGFGGQVAVWPVTLNVTLLGFFNGAFAVAAIGAMMGLAAEGPGRQEGLRMGLFGAAQAIAFGVGSLCGTVAVDIARALIDGDAAAYGTVFILEGGLFLIATVIALKLSLKDAPSGALVPGE